MSDTASAETSSIDPVLLARMTGQLGDREVLLQKAGGMAERLCSVLPDSLKSTIGQTVSLTTVETKCGRFSEFCFGADDLVWSPAFINRWCYTLFLATSPNFAVSLVECLLGGGEMAESPDIERPLSNIEADVSVVFFEQVVSALRDIAGLDPKTPASASRPDKEAAKLAQDQRDKDDFHAVSITLELKVGGVTTPIVIVLPQSTVTKMKAPAPAPATPKAAEEPPASRSDWTKRLSERVTRSAVTLEASINLEPLTLGNVSKLRPGDVVPFADAKDVRVLLKANGRDLCWCEFGKSGNHYMLQVQQPHTLENELVRDLSG